MRAHPPYSDTVIDWMIDHLSSSVVVTRDQLLVWSYLELLTRLNYKITEPSGMCSCCYYMSCKSHYRGFISMVTRWIGTWVCPRAGLEAVGKIKMFFPCHNSNPGRPARILVTVQTAYFKRD
jgi:hypothetical protein